MDFKIYTRSKKLLADTLTPVNIYLKLRDVYAGSFLLESSDYHGQENSLSLICCDPIASFQVDNDKVTAKYPDGSATVDVLENRSEVLERLDQFRNSFDVQNGDAKYISGGLFGYMTYDAVRYFEKIDISITNRQIPDVLYKVFRYVIVIDHFSNQLMLFENATAPDTRSGLEDIQRIILAIG